MSPQELLIALNASERITRAALCCLAAAPERWQHLRPGARFGPAAAELGVPQKQLRRALDIRSRAGELAERELRRAERRGCEILTRCDPTYPTTLHDLALPPPVLYCRGRLPAGPAAVAIVGSRRMGAYGRQAAQEFAAALATAGVTVVSGFARGVDTTAHKAALTAGGRTVAVLGCGLDIDYPRGNAALADEIQLDGAMVSEFPFGAEPRAWRFPIRNRVIAALSVGTLVVEATVKSGSLITAHQALELGRHVYAVPGRIFDQSSSGTNALIADGAVPALSPRDILECLSLTSGQQLLPLPSPSAVTSSVPTAVTTTDPAITDPAITDPTAGRKPPGGLAGKIHQGLTKDRGQTAEEIATRTEAPVEDVLGALLELELGGWTRRAPGPVYLA